MADASPRITTAAGDVDAALLTDGDFGETVTLGIPDGANETWVQFEFPQPFRAYAFTFAGAPTTQFIGTPPIPAGRLEWSDDGQDWVTLATLPGPGHPIHHFAARTYTFEPPTARYYRLVLQRPAANPLAASLGMPPSRGIAISELELSASPRVNRWQEKAQFGIITEYGPEIATPATGDAIAPTRRRRHHGAPAQGRHARLAGAGRPMDGAAHGLLADRHEEPSRVARGHGLRGRQAQSRARGVVLPAVHRPDPRRARPALREELPLSAARQLRSGDGELDRRHDRAVPRAARLRSDALPARAHRARGRRRGLERQVPLGLPPHDRRSALGQPLWRRDRGAEGAGPRPLRRGDGRRVPDERRRAAGEGTRDDPDGRVLDAGVPARTTSRRT